ncbi:Nitrogen fixation protein FixH [Loktanella fryxellensis]|uniref:Nitrogen fixation protein FixH n=1 Tax=Loktanella fryxellensis TaxID=245187 RepID=A0A1H8H9X3_9RHOB|nr:FixH family protein [Loktanella fryxellensis]SEN53121.1 Nitrogen fixation protein FixH [Loktanella fryxellensis]
MTPMIAPQTVRVPRIIRGWHVLAAFVTAFGIVIAVNLTLAVQAVRTFPGLEVDNSYVTSQTFDGDRDAQLSLRWDVAATLQGHDLSLRILQDGQSIAPVIEEAIFGRATSVARDQTPAFTFDGTALRAVVDGGPGNWNLRLRARSADGIVFQQRIVVRVLS